MTANAGSFEYEHAILVRVQAERDELRRQFAEVTAHRDRMISDAVVVSDLMTQDHERISKLTAALNDILCCATIHAARDVAARALEK